jgi:hypothetical protein
MAMTAEQITAAALSLAAEARAKLADRLAHEADSDTSRPSSSRAERWRQENR